MLHERTARALEAAGGETLAAEVAGHWAAAGRPAEELPARVAAAEAAERVFGYAEAAVHWQRAIELCQAAPGRRARPASTCRGCMCGPSMRSTLSGDSERAGVVAEEAYRRFADHPDPATAAVIHHRAAYFRAIEAPAAGLPLIKEALRLFEQAPPSADHAEAWLDYAIIFLLSGEGRLEASLAALNRALEIAEAAGATAADPPHPGASSQTPRSFAGRSRRGSPLLHRGRALAQASRDGQGPAVAGHQRKRRAAASWGSSTTPPRSRCAACRPPAAGRPGRVL